MVEILVAMTLAAIAIIGIMALYLTETKAGSFSRHSTEATVLAEDKIEQLRTQGAATNIALTTQTNINERGVAGGMFTRKWTETLLPNYATISVTVQWSDDGFAHTLTVNASRDL